MSRAIAFCILVAATWAAFVGGAEHIWGHSDTLTVLAFLGGCLAGVVSAIFGFHRWAAR